MNTGDPARGRRLSHEPRRNRARPAAERRPRSGRGEGERRASSRSRSTSASTELLADYSQTREITLKNNGTSAAIVHGGAGRRGRSAHTRRAQQPTVSVPAGGTATVGRHPGRAGGGRGRLDDWRSRVPRGGRSGHIHAGSGEQQRRHAARAVLPGAPVARRRWTWRSEARRSRGTTHRRSTPRRPSRIPAELGRRGRLLRLGPRQRQRGRQRHRRRAGGERAVVRGATMRLSGRAAGRTLARVRREHVRPLVERLGERVRHPRWTSTGTRRPTTSSSAPIRAPSRPARSTAGMGAFVFSTRSAGATLLFLASDPTDSSTVEIGILSRQLCRAGEPCLTANKNFTYSATSFDLVDGGVDAVDGSATDARSTRSWAKVRSRTSHPAAPPRCRSPSAFRASAARSRWG